MASFITIFHFEVLIMSNCVTEVYFLRVTPFSIVAFISRAQYSFCIVFLGFSF